MKKSLLFSAALLAGASAFAGGPVLQKSNASVISGTCRIPESKSMDMPSTRADGNMESFIFSYADSPAAGLNIGGCTGGVTRVYLGFEMRKDDIKNFAGTTVTAFSMYSPFNSSWTSNTINDGNFFISYDLENLIYTQDFEISDEAGLYNKIQMDEPFSIKGDEESIYFGYSFIVPKLNDMYYIVSDCVPNDPTTCIYGISNDDKMPTKFYYGGDSADGALCMALTLECEELPKFVKFKDMPPSICLPTGDAATYPLILSATSGSKIQSVDMEYTLGGELYQKKYVFNPAVSAGASRYITVNVEFPAQSEQLNEEVEFKLTKINGVDNVFNGSGATAKSIVAFVDKLPVRQTLIEEYTGTWCGWCTRGYAALEYIGKNYPEFVKAAFHNEDAMAIMDEDEYPSEIRGFPGAVLNRQLLCDPYHGTYDYSLPLPIVGNIQALNAVTTAWNVSVDHEWESDDVLVAKAEVSNVAGYKDSTYEIAYLLVADGLMGFGNGWPQSNYYESLEPTYIDELNDFCKGGKYGKSSVVGLVFNDVVISSDGIYGVEGSLPKSLEPFKTVEHSLSFDLSKISKSLIPDRNKLRVIAAVLDENGNVLNCAKHEVNGEAGNAVEGVGVENAPAEYFNLNGVKVANPTEGVFIRRQGGKAEKVIVK